MAKEEKKVGLNIRVGDYYVITNDQYQYIVNKIMKNNKTGEEYLVPDSYFGLHHFAMVKDYIIRKIALGSGEIKNLEELNKALANSTSILDKALG